MRLLVNGDYCPPGGLETFAKNETDEESYLAYVSKDFVREIAGQLSSLSDEEIDDAFTQAGVEDADYEIGYLENAIAFYQQTAEQGGAVFIIIN